MPLPPLIGSIASAITNAVSAWWSGTADVVLSTMDKGAGVTPRYWRVHLVDSNANPDNLILESADSLAGPWTTQQSYDINTGTLAGAGPLIATTIGGVILAFIDEHLVTVQTAPTPIVIVADPDNVGGGGTTTYLSPSTVDAVAGPGDPVFPAAEWVEWLDAAGHRAGTLIPSISEAAGGSTFITDALAACTNAVALKIVGEQLVVNAVPAPTDAQWPTVDDWAVLLFQSATTSSQGQLHIPAPKAALFLADGETIDAAAAPVAALIAEATHADHGLRCPDGTRAGTYLGGRRQGKRGPAR